MGLSLSTCLTSRSRVKPDLGFRLGRELKCRGASTSESECIPHKVPFHSIQQTNMNRVVPLTGQLPKLIVFDLDYT